VVLVDRVEVRLVVRVDDVIVLELLLVVDVVRVLEVEVELEVVVLVDVVVGPQTGGADFASITEEGHAS
jgi:hypothetical protein